MATALRPIPCSRPSWRHSVSRFERREAIVGPRDAHVQGSLTNHLALVVDTPDGGRFIAEAGLGEGPLDPLPLAEGAVSAGAFGLRIEREQGGWWVEHHAYGSFPGFWFADAPASLAAFAPHHLRLSTSRQSSFVETLVVERPFDDRIVALRSRTLSVDGPGRRERLVLADADALAAALWNHFGIDPAVLGPERLRRLWDNAVRQHDARRQPSAG